MGWMDVTFRFLGPEEGGVLTEAIEAAYGTTYDVRWVYDPLEVSARLAEGRYVSCVAETAAGELLCHEGMSLAAAGDAVAHSGQAVTLEAARGQHLFTRTKRVLMDWGQERGLAGMFSEATAAHPYSQKANIDLGAHETGFLLGWIPATVENDAAAARRAQAQLGGALLHQAERRQRTARLRAGAPPRDRRPDARPLRAARDPRPAAPRLRAARADRDARRGRHRPQPGAAHRRRARRRPRGGHPRRAPPPLPQGEAWTRSTSTCRSTPRRPPWSPTILSGSA